MYCVFLICLGLGVLWCGSILPCGDYVATAWRLRHAALKRGVACCVASAGSGWWCVVRPRGRGRARARPAAPHALGRAQRKKAAAPYCGVVKG